MIFQENISRKPFFENGLTQSQSGAQFNFHQNF